MSSHLSRHGQTHSWHRSFKDPSTFHGHRKISSNITQEGPRRDRATDKSHAPVQEASADSFIGYLPPNQHGNHLILTSKYHEIMETIEQNKAIWSARKYSEIVPYSDKDDNQASCCGSGCCSTENGQHHDRRLPVPSKATTLKPTLGLGCGPGSTQFAQNQKR